MSLLSSLRFPTLLLLLMVLSTSSYATTAPPVTITESFDGNAVVEFTITTEYDNISGFAVGNNYGFDYAKATLSGWKGVVAVNSPTEGWKVPIFTPEEGSGLPSVTYVTLSGMGFGLDDVTDFDGYNRAFLFYKDGPNFLPANTPTDGFFGLAFAPDSIFAAFGEDEIYTGETSTVPIPGSIILLFSGLVGLIGTHRKK